jgi:CheY-like chemotaxis protein
MRIFKISEIVLVDDDQIVKLVVQKILRKIGYSGTISSFINGFEAIENIKNQVATNSFEFLPEKRLLLLDINMPIMNSWGFLDEFSKLPLVVKNQFLISIITSSISDQDKSQAFSYQEVEDFIQKPLSENSLIVFLTNHSFCEVIASSSE